MGRKEEILEYCKEQKRKVTAKDIIDALYPGKPQPYINSQITELVYEKKLVREDTRPYTVHVPAEDEVIGEVANHSRGHRETRRADVPTPCNAEVEKYMQEWEELENYNLKDLDRYLWQLGKDKFPKKY